MELKNHIKSGINRMTCAIHHQKPLLAIAENDIDLECCCNDFKIKCLKVILKVLLDRKDKDLSVAWRGSD